MMASPGFERAWGRRWTRWPEPYNAKASLESFVLAPRQDSIEEALREDGEEYEAELHLAPRSREVDHGSRRPRKCRRSLRTLSGVRVMDNFLELQSVFKWAVRCFCFHLVRRWPWTNSALSHGQQQSQVLPQKYRQAPNS